MTLFSSATPYLHVQTQKTRNIAVWVSIVLFGLAILAIALDIGPVTDPMIFPAP
jgi:hypothetical protein